MVEEASSALQRPRSALGLVVLLVALLLLLQPPLAAGFSLPTSQQLTSLS